MKVNKKVIFNDPIYGFISIPFVIVYDLIEHPYFQRLRRIKQLGLTHLVYPGAYHTRFQHAMGAMHLMGQAIEVIRSKGHEISEEEAIGVTIAILLHDIGHGPYSHALEKSIVHGITHEDLSEFIMDELNSTFDRKLSLAIKIFQNKYRKRFLHQLVASQLDMDRLDYLKRDSFFTGVSEGVISVDRIIKTLNVVNDQLVVDAKGIYSIEKFLIARRLMYWQVYLHKTVIVAEYLLIKILKRAKELAEKKTKLFATPALSFFLDNKLNKSAFKTDKTVLNTFLLLDDYDIFTSVKVWAQHDDMILSTLCKNMVNRTLHKIEIQNRPVDDELISQIREKTAKRYNLKNKEADYFVFTDSIANNAYDPENDKINILYKDGELVDIADASDQLNISVLSKTVEKYFVCYPKDCNILEN